MTTPAPVVEATRVLVLIPAYNEAQALPGLLAELVARPSPLGTRVDILVVDDGSTDGTAAVARSAGVSVVQLPFNLGVGGAVRTGLRFAVEHDVDQVVIVDGDGQHDPDDIPLLLGALGPSAQMVIGSRYADAAAGYAIGGTRRRAQRILNRIVRISTGFPATDATSGFRALDRPVVELLAERYPVEFLADTVEVIVLVRNAGWTVVEVPVRMHQRQGGVPASRSAGLAFNYLRLLVGIAGTALFGRRDRRRT